MTREETFADRSDRPDPNRFPQKGSRFGLEGFSYLLLMALLVLVAFSPCLFAGASVYDVDLRHVETPIKWFLFKEKTGVLFPLWTEKMGCGFPIHAYGEGGLFYPLNWVFYPLLPMPAAHDANLMFHLLVAGMGAFLLGRRLLDDPAASAVSGVVFAFSGSMFVHLGHVNSIQACAWAPWAFLALDMNREALRPLSVLWLALSIAIMLLTRTQYGFYVIIAMGVVALWHDLTRRPRTVISLPVLLGAVLLGFCMAAVQTLPAIEFVLHSDRASGLSYDAQVGAAASWEQVLWLVAPLWQGVHTQGVAAESIGYVGMTTALMMVISLSRIRNPRYLLWCLLFFLSLLLSMGGSFPPNALIYQLPGFSLFRSHARWLSMTSLAAAVLAGWGANHLLRRVKDPRRRGLLGLVVVLLVFCDLSLFLRPLVSFVDRRAQEAVPVAVAVLSGGGRYFTHHSAPIFPAEVVERGMPQERLAGYFRDHETLNANLGMRYGLSCVDLYAGLHPRWISAALRGPTMKDLSAMNCAYVISEDAVPADGLREVWRNPFFQIYANENVEPRASIVSSILPDGGDGFTADRKMEGEAHVLQGVREDRVTVKVQAEASCFLVLADTFFPGWKAQVNGREEKVFRVNGWMRAVRIPKGRSEVLFRYEPASFRWGLVVSAASILLSALAVAIRSCRKPRIPEP